MGWVYTSTIFYQNYKGLTTLQNAIAILPSTIVGALAAVSHHCVHPLGRRLDILVVPVTDRADVGDVSRAPSVGTSSHDSRRGLYWVRPPSSVR
jgi:hypothetical protein